MNLAKSTEVEAFPDIWTPTLAVIHAQTNALKAARDLLVGNIELRAANIENTIAAQQITAIVDGSILFRSLGGIE